MRRKRSKAFHLDSEQDLNDVKLKVFPHWRRRKILTLSINR